MSFLQKLRLTHIRRGHAASKTLSPDSPDLRDRGRRGRGASVKKGEDTARATADSAPDEEEGCSLCVDTCAICLLECVGRREKAADRYTGLSSARSRRKRRMGRGRKNKRGPNKQGSRPVNSCHALFPCFVSSHPVGCAANTKTCVYVRSLQ